MLGFFATIARIASRPVGKVGEVARDVSASMATRMGFKQAERARNQNAEKRLRRVMER